MCKTAITGWGMISEMGSTESDILNSWDSRKKPTGGELDFSHSLDPRKIRRMGRFGRMCAAVTDNCLKMSGCEKGDNTGIIMNTDYGSINLNIEFGRLLPTPELASPMDFANTVSNAALGNVALYFGLKGPSTLLMGSNALSYSMRQVEKKPDNAIVVCGGDEYCSPVASTAVKKFGGDVISEGVAGVVVESEDSAREIYGRILGDAETGIGFSPLYQSGRDVVSAYTRVIKKALRKAELEAEDIDLVLLSNIAQSSVSEDEKTAVEEIFGSGCEVINARDMLGESFGASAVSSVILGSVLVKNKRYEKVLVLGTEMSGTVEAFVLGE
ncbi:MAG: hypothetical protein GXY08_11525 [Ruminococcus sp.]|nr:hypothetical protein [Ruminococcus sp.]